MPRFEGKAALITGGALGIGGATARRLAAEGAQVLIADIDDDAAAANVARISENGGTAVASHIDVSSSNDCRSMVEETVDAFGKLDILVQERLQRHLRRVANSRRRPQRGRRRLGLRNRRPR